MIVVRFASSAMWAGTTIQVNEAMGYEPSPGASTIDPLKSPRICGVLDFEFGRAAPIELDLAQLCSSLLIWSGIHPITARDEMHKALSSYERVQGSRLSEEGVFACMAAYWGRNYLYWRNLFERSGSHRDVFERQPRRIRSVLGFLETALA